MERKNCSKKRLRGTEVADTETKKNHHRTERLTETMVGRKIAAG